MLEKRLAEAVGCLSECADILFPTFSVSAKDRHVVVDFVLDNKRRQMSFSRPCPVEGKIDSDMTIGGLAGMFAQYALNERMRESSLPGIYASMLTSMAFGYSGFVFAVTKHRPEISRIVAVAAKEICADRTTPFGIAAGNLYAARAWQKWNSGKLFEVPTAYFVEDVHRLVTPSEDFVHALYRLEGVPHRQAK